MQTFKYIEVVCLCKYKNIEWTTPHTTPNFVWYIQTAMSTKLTCPRECSPNAECPPPSVDNQAVASNNSDHL